MRTELKKRDRQENMEDPDKVDFQYLEEFLKKIKILVNYVILKGIC